MNNPSSVKSKQSKSKQEKEETFQKFFKLGLIGMAITSLEKNWVEFNDSLCQMFGYSREDFAKLTWADITHPEDIEADVANFKQVLVGKIDGYTMDKRFIHCDGSIVFASISVGAVSNPDGDIDHFVALVRDITRNKQAEEELKLSAKVFTDTHDGILITDSDLNILDVNPSFTAITGYTLKDVLGKTPEILNSGRQDEEFYCDMWQQINERGHWQGEIWNRKKEGEIYAEFLNISELRDANGNITNYIGVFSDITTTKLQQEKLNLMAHYDVLTKLPNRALFIDRFHQAVAHSKRNAHSFVVCFIDLDNFKQINDSYGHEVGDQLLIKVANRLTSCARKEDTVSRQGGDEFALILNDIKSYEECEQTIGRLHHKLAKPYIINGRTHNISASSGITLYPDDNGDIDTLLRHADHAMYQAKIAGKNKFMLFNSDDEHYAIQKHLLLYEIEQAIENNEFELYYQPKVVMGTGQLYGVEALIRWNHPSKGIVPPLDFLPILDNTDLEIQLGEWVINTAIEQAADWLKVGLNIEVSINISSHHLLSEAFFKQLESNLAKYPTVNPELFQVEILESSVLGDVEAITNIIKQCQDSLGVNFALDDFGTGYSSLTHLRNLPISTVKIDQSFIRDMLDDPDDYTIVDGVIGLAKAFNHSIIAEGVETDAHGLMLLLMGCKHAQGYGIARPMPAGDIPDWLISYKPNQHWLDYNNKRLSTQQNRAALFQLITNLWMDKFTSNILANPNNIQQWPNLEIEKGLGYLWIKREKQDSIFNKDLLAKLGNKRKQCLILAKSIQSKYLNDQIESARNDLNKLRTSAEKLNALLI